MLITHNQNEITVNQLVEKARERSVHAKAPNTSKAYQSDLRDFQSFCDTYGYCALPATPNVVILYITHLIDVRGLKISTVLRRVSAISQVHRAREYATPTQDFNVKITIASLRRDPNIKVTQEEKAPLMLDHLRKALDKLPETTAGIRDRAILLIGWSAALRRSEIVALDREDLGFSDDGVTITIRKSKTNQEGQLEKVSICNGQNDDTCPVKALENWIKVSKITEGAIFRSINRYGKMGGRLSDKSVALLVKRVAASVGLNEDTFSGHSLRAGMATQAARNGVSERLIMKQTRHKSTTVLRRYIREGSAFTDNVTTHLGL